jgi:hypothetical protein
VSRPTALRTAIAAMIAVAGCQHLRRPDVTTATTTLGTGSVTIFTLMKNHSDRI